MNKIAVLVCYRDRPTELALLLESLRNQTFKNFEVFIVDDFSGTPIINYHFLICLMNKMNEEMNFIHYSKNEFNYGVSKSRQKCVEAALKSDCNLFMRVDDDVILENNYIEKLLKVIQKGYDLASGVTPFIGQAQFKRESKFIQPVGNKVILDKEGNFIFNGDDFGMEYTDEAIIPIHHFRSCALYKREIHEKVNYNNNLTKHGFREEQILSFDMILNGYKMAVNTKAIAWHLQTPSGGERFPETAELVKLNEEELRRFTKQKYKENRDFIKKYNDFLNIVVPEITPEELIKPTNLARI